MPVRSWAKLAKVPPAAAGGMPDEGLLGDTADVTTVARIKDDLRAWRLDRCMFVGDAGMYSADNLAALSRGLGRYILAVPMRKVKDIETEVLSRPGRYKPVTDNLQVKEVVVGDGERRKRYVLCLNPEEAKRERTHREQVLKKLSAELNLLREREVDHPKATCEPLASRRYGRYLIPDYTGRPRLDAAKVKAAEKFDGKFVVITNDDTLLAEDIALGYKGGWIIESCFRRMKQTGLKVRPMFHWSPGTRRPGPEPGVCFAGPHFPWSLPFAPLAPAAVGAALFAGFIATVSGSDFSCPCIIGYGSSPSRRGPGSPRATWSDTRSLRFRPVPFMRDGVLDHDGVSTPCMAASHILPLALGTASASVTSELSGSISHPT
jgi:hypothetical protein